MAIKKIQDRGIILKSRRHKERDRLVSILSEHHGKITGIAKGAIHSKRFAGSFDLCACIDFSFVEKQGQELTFIDSASVKHGFMGVQSSLENIGAAFYFLDLCNHLTQDKLPVRNIFILLSHYLYLLEKTQINYALLRSFEIKLLERLGYSPIFHQCVVSGEKISWDTHEQLFSIDKGGTVSRTHASPMNITISRELVSWVQEVLNTPILELPKLQTIPHSTIEDVGLFLKKFLSFHCPGFRTYTLPSQTFVESLLEDSRAQSTAALKSSAI